MQKLALVIALIIGTVWGSSLQTHHIVVFHPNATGDLMHKHIAHHGVNTTFEYEIGDSYKAYSAHLTYAQLTRIKAAGEVAYIERDQMMYATQTCKTQTNAIWGLNRISEDAPDLTGNYHYVGAAGEGAEVFVIDTGILISHNEFAGGRAKWGANYADTTNNDCNGHGTHVAGTVAGTAYGVAKKSTVIAVKVLSCNGSGTNAGVIKGVQYAANQANRKGTAAIANMSLGGGYSKALNDAVAAAVRAGITFVVAAGNENDNACSYSPSSEVTAITVGATVIEDEVTRQKDQRTVFSNYGTCVKVMAPGQLIKAAWYTSNTATNTISGTSMASPHVAGVAALYLGAHPGASPKTIEANILDSSVKGVIDLFCSNNANCQKTPNKLLHSTC